MATRTSTSPDLTHAQAELAQLQNGASKRMLKNVFDNLPSHKDMTISRMALNNNFYQHMVLVGTCDGEKAWIGLEKQAPRPHSSSDTSFKLAFFIGGLESDPSPIPVRSLVDAMTNIELVGPFETVWRQMCLEKRLNPNRPEKLWSEEVRGMITGLATYYLLQTADAEGLVCDLFLNWSARNPFFGALKKVKIANEGMQGAAGQVAGGPEGEDLDDDEDFNKQNVKREDRSSNIETAETAYATSTRSDTRSSRSLPTRSYPTPRPSESAAFTSFPPNPNPNQPHSQTISSALQANNTTSDVSEDTTFEELADLVEHEKNLTEKHGSTEA